VMVVVARHDSQIRACTAMRKPCHPFRFTPA
jgi:hypothetical protein